MRVVTGVDVDPWRAICPDDKLYALAEWALDHQHEWDGETQEAFWHVALPLRPRARGKRSSVCLLALWTPTLPRQGWTDSAIADRFAVKLDTLRHDGVITLAAGYHAEFAAPDPRARTPFVCVASDDLPEVAMSSALAEQLLDGGSRAVRDSINRAGVRVVASR
jgi:hypothetical protein